MHHNTASVLLLAFLTLTFVQSSYEKLFYWKDNVAWLKEHFSATFLKNYVPPALFILLVMELITSILCAVGIIQLLMNDGSEYGLYGSVFSCLTLLMMLFGQRLARDYDGARTIALYYIPSILAVYWLN